MRVYLDDIREAPNGWTKITNYSDLIEFLEDYKDEIKEISLDHDLGEEKTGYDACKWMVENEYWIPIIRIHSANVVGIKNMYQLLDRYAPDNVMIVIDSFRN